MDGRWGIAIVHSPSKQSFEVSFVYGHSGGHDDGDDDDSECLQTDSLNVDSRVKAVEGRRRGLGGRRPSVLIAVIDLRTRACHG